MSYLKQDTPLIKILGKAILLASIQSALGSIEMSSKFTLLSISKDEDDLQKVADALSSYILLGIFWTIGSVAILYSNYGLTGFWAALITNLIILCWIIYYYISAIGRACKKHNMPCPKLFNYFQN
jgi:hypothetical protein